MKVALVLLVLAIAVPTAALAATTTPIPTSTSGGLVDPRTLRTEPYVDWPREDSGFGGQKALIAGAANEISFLVGNPLTQPLAVHLAATTRDNNPQPSQNGQPYQPPVPFFETNETLPARSQTRWSVNVTPPSDVKGYQVSVQVDGATAAWTGRVEQSSFFSVAPAVSVRLVSPAPAAGVATIEQLQNSGGGGFGPSALAFVGFDAPIHFEAEARNLGATEASFVLKVASNSQNSAQTKDVVVSALKPGETRTVPLGDVDLAALDPEAARNGGGRWYGFNVGMSHVDDKPGDFAPSATSFTIENGHVGAQTPTAVTLVARRGFAADAYAPAEAALGQASRIQVQAADFAAAPIDPLQVVVTLDPPYNAPYAVGGMTQKSFQLGASPGHPESATMEFTPLVAGRWTVIVQWPDSHGSDGQATNLYTIDVPSDVDVVVHQDGAAKLPLGGATTVPVSVMALRDLHGASLRLATGAHLTTSHGAVQLTTGGLGADIVSASPQEVPLGDLPAGETRWFNVTVQSRGTGEYNVVPYVLSGAFAYTGLGSETTNQNGQKTTTSTAVLDLVVQPSDVPPALAFAPAILVLVVGAALIVGRKKLAK